MLREVLVVEQNNPTLKRRWFESDYFDLFIWQDPGGAFVRFQLCYDVELNERALVWSDPEGFNGYAQGCVEATYRDAAYYDYYNVLVEDCVAARDRKQHEASVMIQKMRHDVVTMDQIFSIWSRYGDGSLSAPRESSVAQMAK